MTLRIDQYSFGKMTVNGQVFTTDMIIYPDGRIQDNWWRKKGHELVPEDIELLLDTAPGKLIIGTGASGQMSVSSSVMALCQERGIEVEAHPTADAVARFNDAAAKTASVGACFHLTC